MSLIRTTHASEDGLLNQPRIKLNIAFDPWRSAKKRGLSNGRMNMNKARAKSELKLSVLKCIKNKIIKLWFMVMA